MGFFTSNKRVTPREMKRDIKSELLKKGFTRADLRSVDRMTSGDFDENGKQGGMDRKEIGRLMKDMDKHPSWHTLSKDQQQTLREALEKKL
jgi:hypothetical protein